MHDRRLVRTARRGSALNRSSPNAAPSDNLRRSVYSQERSAVSNTPDTALERLKQGIRRFQTISGWVYDIASGDVLIQEAGMNEFISTREAAAFDPA